MTDTHIIKLGSLKKRSEFLHVRDGAYSARGAIVIQTRESCAKDPQTDTIRFGVTATKRIGNAVVRNRAKRRLRQVAQQLLPTLGHVGQDYVLIARDRTPIRDWDHLVQDARRALHSLPNTGQSPTPRPTNISPPSGHPVSGNQRASQA